MSTTYIAFDRRSGQILSVHHGANDAADARECCIQQHTEISDEHVAVTNIFSDAMHQEKRYKVDIDRKVLIEVVEEDGVGFGFGATHLSRLG
ncbi:MAG TPA: hypothetical protein DGG95_13510 [Cytophagales bacterium]|nr:hypothetical protein [Cytophagales bacterium]